MRIRHDAAASRSSYNCQNLISRRGLTVIPMPPALLEMRKTLTRLEGWPSILLNFLMRDPRWSAESEPSIRRYSDPLLQPPSFVPGKESAKEET